LQVRRLSARMMSAAVICAICPPGLPIFKRMLLNHGVL